MFTIENELLKVAINKKGAELDSIYHKQHQLEYLWSGDPAVWGKKSPLLFPIVGTLKNNTYYYEGRPYELSRHGFARDSEFSMLGQMEDHSSITLSLNSNPTTLQKFPFDFSLFVNYALIQSSLSVSYTVINKDDAIMFFSIGGHPAFKVPLTADSNYEDYYLEFDKKEHAGRWPVSPEGLIESLPAPLLEDTNRLPLTRELFQNDALVFKHLNSHQVSLRSEKTPYGLTFDFASFPYLGIWAAKKADFVCIEPWYGIADSVTGNQQLPEKEGIQKLKPAAEFKATWNVELF